MRDLGTLIAPIQRHTQPGSQLSALVSEHAADGAFAFETTLMNGMVVACQVGDFAVSPVVRMLNGVVVASDMVQWWDIEFWLGDDSWPAKILPFRTLDRMNALRAEWATSEIALRNLQGATEGKGFW